MPGLQALSASLRATKTPHDFICMVTPDVTLSLVQPQVTRVVPVPYLTFQTKPMKTAKQRKMYDSWMADSYTKWNALCLTEYSKILFLDLDIIVLENLDHLFERPTPAATFSSPWAEPFTKTRGAIANPYQDLRDGDRVSRDLIEMGLHGVPRGRGTHGKHDPSFVLIATTVLLQPSRTDYERYVKLVRDSQPFGFENCLSAFDEQSLSLLYSDWYHISQRYNAIPWHVRTWLLKGEQPALYHYFNTKPWDMRREEWPDLEVWYRFYDSANAT